MRRSFSSHSPKPYYRTLLQAARGKYIPPSSLSFFPSKVSSWLSLNNDVGSNNDSSKEDTLSATSTSHSKAYQKVGNNRKPLKCFALQARHIKSIRNNSSNLNSNGSSTTPNEFHAHLCHSIRNAKKRVKIASLYIGPAKGALTNKDPRYSAFHMKHDDVSPAFKEELELLHSIQHCCWKKRKQMRNKENDIEVKILMDSNRAMRPVPNILHGHSTTTSADAVHHALTSTRYGKDCKSSKDRKQRPQNVNGELYLFPAQGRSWFSWLPSPLDEVFGVFHLKAYIIDDDLIISGANLSQEYFTDRHDRYIIFSNGANGLVDFYAKLIDILADYGSLYHPEIVSKNNEPIEKVLDNFKKLRTMLKVKQFISKRNEEEERKKKLIDALSDLFDGSDDILPVSPTESNNFSQTSGLNDARESDDIINQQNTSHDRIVTYAVPTFQIPRKFLLTPSNNIVKERELDSCPLWPFPSDVEVIQSLLVTAILRNPNSKIKLSSAYLNPTSSLIAILKKYSTSEPELSMQVTQPFTRRNNQKQRKSSAYLITAGPSSHGFTMRKKQVTDNKFSWKSLIPLAYFNLAKEAARHIAPQGGKVLLYKREGWTFHTKGLWLVSQCSINSSHGKRNNDMLIKNSGDSIAATVIGSTNFGWRSEHLDWESNIILIMNDKSIEREETKSRPNKVQSIFSQEWNDMCQYVQELRLDLSSKTNSNNTMSERVLMIAVKKIFQKFL